MALNVPKNLCKSMLTVQWTNVHSSDYPKNYVESSMDKVLIHLTTQSPEMVIQFTLLVCLLSFCSMDLVGTRPISDCSNNSIISTSALIPFRRILCSYRPLTIKHCLIKHSQSGSWLIKLLSNFIGMQRSHGTLEAYISSHHPQVRILNLSILLKNRTMAKKSFWGIAGHQH